MFSFAPRILALLACTTWLLVACSRPQEYNEKIYVFGTLVDVTLWDVSEQKAQQSFQELNERFQQMHHDWHAWEQGPLTDLNQAIAEGRSLKVDPSLIPLLEKSQEACERSGCLFNPAIGKLIAEWGFHSSERPVGPLPSREKIAALVKQNPSMLDITIKDGVVSSSNRAVDIDLGGIAKGYAVGLGLQWLRDAGVHNAIINAGGGLGVIGSHGDRPWRVGIRHPQGNGVLASLEVRDGEQVHTSGNYERFREEQGVRYAHIIDPRTGWPVEGITSATVIEADGSIADAAATAMVVAGVNEWSRVAKQMGIHYVMLVDEEGTVYMNPRMAMRVQFSNEAPKPRVVLSEEL
ncbi:MAG TPA: FAD:protein FMN transferase [Gammaproteobacteria bacterium]